MTLTAAFVTNRTVPFQRVRHLLERLDLQEGAWAAGDFKITERGAGATMSVDAAAGDAWVEVDTGTRNGLAPINSDAVENKAVSAAHGTLPRVDSVVLRYNDSSIPTGAGDTPTVEVIAGTATSGATLDNRNGAPGGSGGPAMPADTLLLADVLVPAASSSVVNANIRDRRKWARGANHIITRTANAGGTDDYSTTSGVDVAVDATNLAPRLECSGVPLIVALHGLIVHSGATAALEVYVDGAEVGLRQDHQASASFVHGGVILSAPYTPAAGSHKFEARWNRGGAGTAILRASAATPLSFTVREDVRQNAAN